MKINIICKKLYVTNYILLNMYNYPGRSRLDDLMTISKQNP